MKKDATEAEAGKRVARLLPSFQGLQVRLDHLPVAVNREHQRDVEP
jgi:hypothetical protein